MECVREAKNLELKEKETNRDEPSEADPHAYIPRFHPINNKNAHPNHPYLMSRADAVSIRP